MKPFRLPPREHEWIDRSQRIAFQFEGETLEAYAGDVLSSALLANGKTILGRSFKYHRPRSVLSTANHDANVLFETQDDVNIRADVTAPLAGGDYRAVNTIGGVRADRARFLGWLKPVLPVGFYYKAFIRPAWAFRSWENAIRRLAGLGRVNPAVRGPRLPITRRFADVLVIGGGVSGLAAARYAASRGLDTVLCDENARFGGSAGFALARDPEAQAWLAGARAELGATATCSLRSATTAAAVYADRSVVLAGASGIERVVARAIVVASGAIEQPAVFARNDLPGIMLASGALRLVHRYALAPCTRAVVLGANVDAYRAAIDLQAAGIEIAAFIEMHDEPADAAFAAAVRDAGIEIFCGYTVKQAHAGHDGELVSIDIAGPERQGGNERSIACDGLLMSVGWSPAAQLLIQGGARLEFDENLGQSVPAVLPDGLYAAGRVNGVYDFQERIADGEAAAAAALRYLGADANVARPPREQRLRSHQYPLAAGTPSLAFVDFDEDVQLKDLAVACREGFDNVELLKRYTTNGMGPSQGKHSNANAARFLASWHGRSLDAVGTTTTRPFYHPVPLGHLAGRRLRPEWRTPLHDWHEQAGAVWQETGAWQRPRYYGPAPLAAAIEAEYFRVRAAAGVIDVSTLGKFTVAGSDAGRLLDLAYTSRLSQLKPGRMRYVVMVDQRGIVSDDGIAARIDESQYFVTAGSGHAQATARTLYQLRDLARLNCEIIDRSRNLAAVNLAGPLARDILQSLTDIDLDADRFPFMSFRTGQICGVEARVMRVGFVGELGFEIYCAPSAVADLWRQLLEHGAAHGIGPFGVDAQRLLRLEKGHVIVGQDTDGLCDPYEAGLAALVTLDKPAFLGRAALDLLSRQITRRLVGFIAHAAPGDILESHLVICDGAIAGRVTSVGHSYALGHTIGLVMVSAELADPGTRLNIRGSGGRIMEVTVSEVPFYDAPNARQRLARAAAPA